MKFKDWLKDKDIYEVAHKLMISKPYIQAIAAETTKPSKRLALRIQELTTGQILASELCDTIGPLKRRCPCCGSYIPKNKKITK